MKVRVSILPARSGAGRLDTAAMSLPRIFNTRATSLASP